MGIAESKSMLTTPQAYTDFERQGYNVFQKDGQNYVEIDGNTCLINPWDTVWTVKHRNLLTNKQNNAQRPKLLKELDILKQKYKLTSEIFNIKMDELKDAGHRYITFLMSNHATNLSDLKGTQEYEQGKALRKARSLASLDEIHALADVLGTNNSIQGVCTQLRYTV